jgi:glutamyl-tRNA reductase
MLVTSRSAERTADLASSLGGEAVPFAARGEAMAQADIVITSTSAEGFVVDRAMVEAAMGARASRPLLLIDIAVPRDVDPAASAVAGAHVYDIDELQTVAEKNLRLREQEIAPAERIVDDEVAKFGDWLRSLEVVPTIAAIRERAETLRAAEVERTLAKMRLSDADRARVEAMTSALVKKLLHDPVRALKTPGEGDRHVEAARTLFGLDAPSVNGAAEHEPDEQ